VTRSRLNICVAIVAIGASVAGCSSTEEAKNLTGVDLTVRFDAASSIEELSIKGTLDGQAAFAPGILPETPRALDPAGETLLILLDDAMADATITLVVDGLSGGTLQATTAADVTIVGKQLVRASIMLGPPPECGDGEVAEGLEACDDDNTDPGDGCDGQCDIEPGWDCSNQAGAASTCSELPACSDGADNDMDGLTDFDGGDDGCTNAEDDSEEGECTASCAANNQCQETCQGADCDWSCDAASCGCELDCNEADTSCNLVCDSNDCSLQCDNAGDCSATCTSGSQCDVDCQGSATCDVACTMSSSCDINCDGAQSCSSAECRNGSDCLLNCGSSVDCGFATCQGGGGAQSCPGNIVVCNRPCP